VGVSGRKQPLSGAGDLGVELAAEFFEQGQGVALAVAGFQAEADEGFVDGIAIQDDLVVCVDEVHSPLRKHSAVGLAKEELANVVMARVALDFAVEGFDLEIVAFEDLQEIGSAADQKAGDAAMDVGQGTGGDEGLKFRLGEGFDGFADI